MTDTALDAAFVHLGFRLTLRRPPENEAVVAHYLGLGLTPPEFLAVLMESDEFMERQRRLLTRGDLAVDAPAAAPRPAAARALLFGAFGNGNVGDAAQVSAVAALLRALAPGGLPAPRPRWISPPVAGSGWPPMPRPASGFCAQTR